MNTIRACMLGGCFLWAHSSEAALIGMEARLFASGTLSSGESVDALHLYVIFDEQSTLLNIFDVNLSFGSRLYQTGAPFGGDVPPNSGFFGFDPDLQWDSYVAIGDMDSADGTDTTTDPSFEFGAGSITGGWYDSDPGTPDGATDISNEVFIGQVTLLNGTWEPGFPVQAFGATYFDSAGATVQEIVAWPTPGTGLILLAGLGMASRRRR